MAETEKATIPCVEDCELKLAASEKLRKVLDEQMRGMVGEIEALRDLLTESRSQHAHDHAAAAAHALKVAAELQSRADRARTLEQTLEALTRDQRELMNAAEATTATAVAASVAVKQKIDEANHSLLELTRKATETTSHFEARVERLVEENAHLTTRVNDLRSEIERGVQMAQLQASTLAESNRIAHVSSESLDICNKRILDLQQASSAREALLLELTDSRARLQQESH